MTTFRTRFALAGLLLATTTPVALAADADVERLQGRLAALRADPALGRLAVYEQMEAQQAIATLDKARRSERADALYLAGRRVEIAEVAASVQAAQAEVSRLDLQRSELLLEASRRDAQRARQENERLRLQAQIQAEEAERLRLAAEAEALARTDAEEALGKATGRQVSQLSAARRKEAELARQEAELVSGKKLPAARFQGEGEVFSLPGNAYASGKSGLSGSGGDAATALAAYLQIVRGNVRVSAWDSDGKRAQARADALREALVGAGVAGSRIRAEGKRGAATAARAAEVAVTP